MRLAFLCCFLVGSYSISAYCFQIDSLEQKLDLSSGTERVDLLDELFKQYFNSDPVLAMDYAQEALELARDLEYVKGVAASYNDIGVIYRLRGQFDRAVENYLEAYRNYSSIGEQEGLAKVLNNIGTVYSIKQEYGKALENYLESYNILQELGLTEKIIGSLNNIGNVYQEQKEYEQALAYYLQALEMQQELGRETQFDPLTNIGNIHFNLGDFDKALEVYFESLEVEREQKNLYGQSYALSNIGVTYHEKKEYKMAISFQTQALNLASAIQDQVLLNNIYKALADSYYSNDDLLMAYNSLLLYISARDSLFDQESNERITQLEIEFEFLKEEAARTIREKDQNISRLQDRNQQITILLIILASILGVSLIIGLYRNFYAR